MDKDAAGPVVTLQKQALSYLTRVGTSCTAAEVAVGIERSEAVETIFKILDHLSRDPSRGVNVSADGTPANVRFSMAPPESNSYETI